MTDTGIIGIILIITTIAFSYKGFTNENFFDGYKFEIDRVLINKDYKRLVTSGFLHVSWSHLILNMASLYAFSGLIESNLGGLRFLLVYFASLVGGNVLSLFIHRNHGDYSSVGASGAICGIIFASIALFPRIGIGFLGLPFSIPSWLFGILYVLYSIYGIKSQKDNIGHDAHLGGALIGMTIALIMQPSAFLDNYLTILIIAIPTLAFIFLIVKKPHILFIDNVFFNTHKKYYSIDHKYNEAKNNDQKEIDRILDKINKKGLKSLSKSEQEQIKDYSKSLH